MNQLTCFLITVIWGITLSSPISGQTASKAKALDPVEFGKQFTSVCKVGLKGGDGTLINSQWVLTAAHVAEGMYERTKGKLFIYFENGSEYKIRHIFLHPKFEPMGKYDVALLEVEEEVANISPIKINPDTSELNQIIILAGHGDKRRADGSWIKDGKLRGYTNKIDQVNETHIGFDYDSPDDNPTEREGTGGPGDSGGPAFIVKGNTYYVAGVSSMGKPGVNGPASFGAIEHYVRVSKFQDWIRETMKEKNPDKAYRLKELSPENQKEIIEWPNTTQSKHAKIIIDALSTYSEEKMMVAISQAYDESVLKKRTEKEIIQNMPVLVRELQNSKPRKILGKTPAKLSVEMNKGSQQYVLDIFFSENSQKIEQMGFGKLN